MKTNLRDKYLIYKLKRGDKEAFSGIYNLYAEKIFRFVFLKTFSREESEDIASQVFYKFLIYLNNPENKIETLQAFLYQMARNLVIDFYRRKKEQTVELKEGIENKILIDKLIDPDKKLDEKFELEKIKLALKDLNEDYREVIILYYLEDMSVKEISKVLDRSREAVRILIHRALKTLKEKLNE